LTDNRLGACLADDMGLGKTLQAIALISKTHEEKKKRSMVIMPKSLIFNWESEIKKFAPNLKIAVYYGINRELSILKKADVVLTTYGTIRNDIENLLKEKFDLLVLDESQNIKNINSQTTKAVLLLNAEKRVALSGTPVENNLLELYSLFRFLNPDMFGTVQSFTNNYIIPIQKYSDTSTIEELRKADLYNKVSQAFVVLLPVKSVGVMGDERTYEYTAVLRSANTIDFMTATWSHLPYDFLEKVSNRILNEVKGINRLTYDISSKPPATIEWE